MKVTTYNTGSSNSNQSKAGSSNSNQSKGFTMYAKVLETGKKVGNEEALLVEKISGENPGGQFLVTMSAASKGKRFDAEGLIALKIKGGKKGTNIGLRNVEYKDKTAEIPVIETRRATKVGKDFRPGEALMVTSFQANIGNLRGNILTPAKGSHAVLTGSPDEKIKALSEMVSKTELTDNQGVAVVVSGKLEDGKTLTVQSVISRYTQNEKEGFTSLDADGFKAKTAKFFEDGNMANFGGTMSGSIKDVLGEGEVTVAVIPSERIALTGADYLNDGMSSVRPGISSVGLAIDPANDDREYPIIQIGALEVLGIKSGLFGEPELVRPASDSGIIARAVYQIDMMSGNDNKATSEEKTETTPAKKDEVDEVDALAEFEESSTPK